MPIDIKGKTIVFTGALSSMTRNEAKGIAYKLGARVSDSMGVNVDYLVVGDKPGSKEGQAKRYGTTRLSERDWNIVAGVDKVVVSPEYISEAPKVYKKINVLTVKNVFTRISEKKTIPPKVSNDFPELDLD